MKLCLFVSTESTHLTDRHTDRRTDRHRMTAQAALMHASCGKKVVLSSEHSTLHHCAVIVILLAML